MIEFLKKILANRDRVLTFVLFDDDEPESSTSYQFKPGKLLLVVYATAAATAIAILFVVMFTPAGALVYNQQDAEIRQSVIEIQQKVQALTDSLNARDKQLTEMRNVLASGADTTFAINPGMGSYGGEQIFSGNMEPESYSVVNNDEVISTNEIIFSSLFKSSVEFPAFYPVKGTVSRDYNVESGHFGIDIATQRNVPFRTIAEGAVINQGWTVNFGYVIHVQHNNGLVSVYKHASSVTKAIGDIVLKKDILGTVGDVGIMSSGPHLHVEIWKNGVPQNPNLYLVKS